MPSPQFEAILQFLHANPTPPDIPFAEQQAAMEMMAAQTPLPDDVYTEPIDAGGVPGLLVAAPDVNDQRIILYLHGGGYCLGSSLVHRDLGWRLSAAAGARVLLLDYRLAPEFPFPTAVHDVLTAYEWLLANGFAPTQIAFGGDSAGGGLAVAAMTILRDDGRPLPAAALCISPWFDLTQTSPAMTERADMDPLLTAARLNQFATAYLGDVAPTHPHASPLFADLTGLPPLLIQVGSAEILHDDAARLAEKAHTAGVAAQLAVWEEMIHVWHGFAAIVPEAQEAITAAGTFFQENFA